MRRILPALLIALAAGAVACRPPAGPAPSAAPPLETSRYTGPLVSSFQVEPAGDSVRFSLQLTNPTTAPVRLSFSSGMTHDFAVREGTRDVWRWSADRSFVQALMSVSLGAGETRSYTEVWRPGAGLRGRRLTAVAWLTSTNHPIQQSTAFALP
ncbi:MAG TPA: BsuPI-related putative proteinase inhibitor [Longimicrobium sp.]|jgi:hypothetical protein